MQPKDATCCGNEVWIQTRRTQMSRQYATLISLFGKHKMILSKLINLRPLYWPQTQLSQ